MSKLTEWLQGLFGVEIDEEPDPPIGRKEKPGTSEDHFPDQVSKKTSKTSSKSKDSTSVATTTINDVTVMVISPLNFEEAKKTVDFIKSQRPVVANFEDTERTLFQRFIDFVSGAIYSMDGKIEKISQYVFLFAPPNVLINAEDKRKFISKTSSPDSNSPFEL